MTENSEKTTV